MSASQSDGSRTWIGRWLAARKLRFTLTVDGSVAGRFATCDEAFDHVGTLDYGVFRVTKREDGIEKWAGDGFACGATGADLAAAGIAISSKLINDTPIVPKPTPTDFGRACSGCGSVQDAAIYGRLCTSCLGLACPHCAEVHGPQNPMCADRERWTDAEKDAWREQTRRVYPWMQFAPSSRVMADRFGARNREEATR